MFVKAAKTSFYRLCSLQPLLAGSGIIAPVLHTPSI